MRAVTDDELMERVQGGDVGAFEELYDRHAPRAMRVASALCRDRETSADAVQDAFLAIWRGRDRYRPEAGSFRAWAMTVVQNKTIDLFRKETARGSATALDENVMHELIDDAPAVWEQARHHESSETLLHTLAAIPAAQREAVVLSFFGGLTHSEIAAHLSLPAGTVKGRMRLGLAKLRAAVPAELAQVS
jgi:RNA polymerase sigma-70 factor (ECF subfamily)